ncbi:AfsR/SARP family transcriptional regulator [Streptomyces sp. CB00455]|uniref:AfsR/SARP family transcriptional regulator n=1 Tax=Streptomyces sp. CB00455 TaxID=1703927 RepID=UPI0009A0DFB3|nr:BTAD domain-containing putative transcriptional regulator [Streptomyces sp. CB00455]
MRDDGTPVAVGGARLRALLTALALRPGRAVPVHLLVAEVWDGDRPADAPAALQALVARLRRALGHEAVRSAGGGYLLAAGREDVDLYRFERLARSAGEALDAGDAAKAAELYEDALDLWRGPALADLPDPAAESARWDAVRGDARRGLLTAAVTLGGAERVLPELTALCAGQPLDEPLQALRIRALRDAGRPAEALAAYDTVRRDLADRLGTDPGPALRTLHAELLTPGPATPAPGPRPTRPAAGRSDSVPAGPDGQTGQAPYLRTGPSSAGPDGAPARIRPAGAGGAHSDPGGTPDGHSGQGAYTAREGAQPQTGDGAAYSSLQPVGQAAEQPGWHPARRGNLRARLTTFVGREDDIRTIGDDLARARLVTLLGPGGAGKTRLSQEAAEAHDAGAWPDGVWLVELAPVDDPEDVAEAVLAALGARETKLRGASAEEMRALTDRAGDAPLDRLAEHCARQRILLLLDNCEHVIGAAAELAERLLTHCPGVRILATSREPLGVPGESLRPVEPLPDPVALRLLADRGAAARPGFSVAEDAAAAAEICRRLDGLPLAIELAAARLRLLTPRQIADRLDDRFRLLTGGARTVLPRQQTLRAVVDWSWDLLDEAERTVLRRLSVFAGGCDLAAAETVCAGPAGHHTAPAPAATAPAPAALDVAALDVADTLGSLVDKSLVVAAPAPDGHGMRYRLLETVGEYAAARLAEAGHDWEDTERRHLVHYRELARTREPLLRGHGQRAAADRLSTEYENLRTALRRAVAARDTDEVLCLIHSLGWYWHMHDLRTESRHWSEAAAALGPDPFAHPVVPAEPVYAQLVDTPPPYGDALRAEAWRAVHLVRLASRDQSGSDWNAPEVLAQVDGVLATYRPGLPQTCRTPASLWIYAVMIAGDAGLLQQVIDATVRTARELGYRWELASALQLRANILANRADWAGDASRDADESLALFRELGDAWGCAEALSARAESREKRGEYGLAARDFREAVAYAERLGAKAQVTVLRVRMAGTLTEDGHTEEAERILTEITDTVQQYGNEAMPAARMFLAGILGRTGRISEARAQLRILREEFTFGAYAIFDGFLLGTMAWLDNREGRYEDALAQLRRAIQAADDPLSRMVAPQMPAVYLTTAALSLASPGGPGREYDAARLLGAYRALLPPRHFPVTTEREDSARAEELARAALGDAVFEAAYAEGGGLSLEEATALV